MNPYYVGAAIGSLLPTLFLTWLIRKFWKAAIGPAIVAGILFIGLSAWGNGGFRPETIAFGVISSSIWALVFTRRDSAKAATASIATR